MRVDTSSCSRPGSELWEYSDHRDDDNGMALALLGTRVTPLPATSSLQRVNRITAEVAVNARSPLKEVVEGLGTAEPAKVAGKQGLRTTTCTELRNKGHSFTW